VVHRDLGDDAGSILTDRGQIEQVVLNLAVNARDAMPMGGRLEFSTGVETLSPGAMSKHATLEPGRYVRLTVSDTGTGMREEVVERAFDPFFTTKPKGIGTGLGLATVYGIVTAAGGDIQVSSAEGMGTTFEMLFPEALPEEPQGRAVPLPEVATGSGETILLVEDDDIVRSVTLRMLRANGYEVVEASGGKEALFKFDDLGGRVELLLTDVVMPEMSGVELADRLRGSRTDLRVLFMSGYSADVFDADRRLDEPLLQKPFEERDLLRAIDGLLQPKVPDDEVKAG
jgi:CheY-like chemotaxis protein